MSEVVIDGVRYLPAPTARCKKSTIGDLARAARKRKDETLRAAAANMGFSVSYLCEIEKGIAPNPSLSIVQTLIQYYGITFDQISTPTVPI